MLRSHTLHQLVSCTLLLLVFLSGSGESRLHLVAREGVPDRTGSQQGLLLEAVKTGILSTLGMDREPRPTQKATVQEMKKMHQLYREKLREMRGNSSQKLRETWQPKFSTVLFPATVEQVKVLRREHPHSDQHMQWYRAIFHKIPNIQTEETLSQAELMMSWHMLNKHTSVQPEVRQEVKVKVNRRRPTNAAAWTRADTQVHGNVSASHDATLDISPEVERWTRTDGGQALIVDVGMVVANRDDQMVKPTISLKLDLVQPKSPERTRRSTKEEDDCDERGWCCRKSLTVSFKDIGWTDWVVAPAEYTMYFCDGTCPHNYKPASMHTQVKSRLQQINKSGSPRPCCVPAAYEPMVLMHYDSRGRLKLTPFDDLIVTKCHCA